jgi:hypothetical protein
MVHCCAAGAQFGLQVQKQHSVVDIDANNAGNPLACAEYARDIFDHLHEIEVCTPNQSAGLSEWESNVHDRLPCGGLLFKFRAAAAIAVTKLACPGGFKRLDCNSCPHSQPF